MNERKRTLFVIGIYVCLGIFSCWAVEIDTWRIVLEGVWQLLSGRYKEITPAEQFSAYQTIAILSALMVMMAVGAQLAGMLAEKILKSAPSSEKKQEKRWQERSFLNSFVNNLIEECIFRGFLLGVLPEIPFLSGATVFYILFVGGNAVWAFFHYTHWVEGERSVLRLLPHVIGGIFLTYCFLAFGFWPTVAVHFLQNSIMRLSFKLFPEQHDAYAY